MRRIKAHQLKHMLANNREDTRIESLGVDSLRNVAATCHNRATRKMAMARMETHNSRPVYCTR